MSHMILKVCGMRDPDNIRSVAVLGPTMMGFIFHPGSPRYAGALDPDTVRDLAPAIEATAVFVDTPCDTIAAICRRYGIATVQLHGSESPDQCMRLRDMGHRVVKAIGIADTADLAAACRYDGCADMLLFDTRSPRHGGTGVKFDWDLLRGYSGATPYLLSGGIGPGDAGVLSAISHDKMAGIDINSRFESAPGVKDISLISHLIHTLHNNKINIK